MKKQYVLFPSVPTPNGGLHLGHVGGPYLAADIAARALRMQGHEAIIMCGTDCYDSYVSARAEQEQTSEAQVANHYHDLIAADLKAMHIEIKTFVNPLSDQYKKTYDEVHYRVLKELQNADALTSKTEYIPWNPEKQTYITGYALQGNCPDCGATIAGYFCEICGAHFKPEDVRNKNALHEKQVNNLYLQSLRLTTHAKWGLAYANQQVLFNYGFIYAYFLFLGTLGLNTNVFAPNTKVTTIASFGIDNKLVFMNSIQSMSKALGFKPIDHYLVNHFYYLAGKKFSTSKGHAIWVRDIVKQNLDPDIVRLYLASINVKDQIGNVSQEELMRFYTKTKAWMDLALSQPPTIKPLEDIFQTLIAKQQALLKPNNFSPHLAVNYLFECLQAGESMRPTATWLRALCILSFPFMPNFSKKLWRSLGFRGEPNYKDNYMITSACA